jgi:hypothetical protein
MLIHKKDKPWLKVSKQVVELFYQQIGMMYQRRTMKEKIGLHLQRDNNGKKDKFDVTYINLITFIVWMDEIFA